MIGIVGRARSGKDTIANHIVKYGYRKYSFATPIKEIAKIMFFFSDEELENKTQKKSLMGITPREAMQIIGTEMVRDTLDENFWVKHLLRRLDGKRTVISDVRFQNEADMISKNGGILIEIIRPNNTVLNHRSEHVNIKCDYVIVNDGSINDLYDQVDMIMGYIKTD